MVDAEKKWLLIHSSITFIHLSVIQTNLIEYQTYLCLQKKTWAANIHFYYPIFERQLSLPINEPVDDESWHLRWWFVQFEETTVIVESPCWIQFQGMRNALFSSLIIG